jgi:potassium/hydrogen antiporter
MSRPAPPSTYTTRSSTLAVWQGSRFVNEGQVALVVGVLLAAGLAASLAAGRLRMPGLVLVLAIGMAIGSDGLGLIPFDDFELARQVGVIALAFILFEGGLSSGFDEIRPVLRTSILLATLGTVGTAALTAVGAGLLFDQLSTLEALLLGSTVAGTDAAAVFAVLRGSTLRRRLARTLEGESGINDPIAVLLVIGCIEAIQHPDFGLADALWLAVRQLSIGFVVGLAVAAGAVLFLRRVRLPSAGLYPVASVATGALAFGAAASLDGSGFLAVYLAGLVLGTASTPARRTIVTFHDGLAWVAQLGLFLTLGLLVFPQELDDIALKGAVIAVLTAAIARPIAAVVVTAFSDFHLRERLLLGWAGLRGATPIVFATFPVTEHIDNGHLIFNVAFFVVLLSTVLQGTTIEPTARLLGVTSDEAALPAPLVEPVLLNRLGAEVVQFPVRPGDAVVGHPVRELGLPREALLNVIVRGERAIPPRGSTVVEAGDQLHLIVRQEVAVEFQDVMRLWRTGPLEAHKRPRPRVLSRPAVTSVRPWQESDGNPSRPAQVVGLDVVDQLRTRRDEPGALVALADGRFAVTGRLLAVGPAGDLQGVARRRLARASTPAERAWWQEVVGALAR